MNDVQLISLWIFIGGLAGWIASRVLETRSWRDILANMVIGVSGGAFCGFTARSFFAQDGGALGYWSVPVALMGSCVVLSAWKAVARRAAVRVDR